MESRTAIRIRRLAVPLLPVLFSLASPALGEGMYEPVPLKDHERHLLTSSNEYEEKFERWGLRYHDPEVDALVARIGRSLQPEPTDAYIRYRFFLIRDPLPNAFALPDGQVYVHTGMVAWLDNEAQLAGLLGHEINHAAGHHGILSFRNVRRTAITGMILGPYTLGLSDIFLILALLGYSRDLEEEADLRALEPALAAGYDLREVPELFDLLARDFEGIQPRRSTKWLTHPQLEDRSRYLRERIDGWPGGIEFSSLRTEAGAYQRLTRPLAHLTVDDLIRSDYPRSATVLAQRLVDRDLADPSGHLALGDAFLALGPGEAYAPEATLTKREKKERQRERVRSTREEREAAMLETEEGRATLARHMAAAAEAYREALDLDGALAEARRGLGYALLRLGDEREAARSLMQYLKMRPEAPDRAAVLDELRRISQDLREGQKGDQDGKNPE
ncbi:MAG: M48 family metalloprotease [Acidobacteria bacterium]|nr:M48 family metalloprotease [Acidobacteriota bacterium]